MASIATRTLTILSAATQSEAFEARQTSENTFSIPTVLTGTTIQPQFSNNGTDWTAVGSAIAVTINNTYVIPADVFKARYGRLVSDASEAADRIITLGLRR